MAKELKQKPLVEEDGGNDWIRRGYVFRSSAYEILDFIEKNPYLGPLLRSSLRRLAFYFPHARLSLEKICYQDSLDDQQLIVFVKPQDEISLSQAEERFNTFEDNWWLPNLHLAKGKLCIVLE